MVSHTVRGLQFIMDALQDTSEKYNLNLIQFIGSKTRQSNTYNKANRAGQQGH